MTTPELAEIELGANIMIKIFLSMIIVIIYV